VIWVIITINIKLPRITLQAATHDDTPKSKPIKETSVAKKVFVHS